MAGTYLTLNDIVAWIDDWSGKNSTPTDVDVASFAEELIGKIGQMDFRASNGGAAIGYAGVIGGNGPKSGIFQTVEQITEASDKQYSFINNCAENIQNNNDFIKHLMKQ